MRGRLGVLAGFMVVALALGIPSTGRTGGEEPPATEAGENLTGPALVGVLEVTITGVTAPYTLEGTFSGWSCKGQPGGTIEFSGGTSLIALADLQAEHLMDQKLDGGVDLVNLLVPGCYQDSPSSVVSGQRLLVNTVLSFSKTATTATATVVVMAVALRT